MDLSKFKVSDWLIVGGALGFLIFGTFLKWFRVSIEGFGDTGGNEYSKCQMLEPVKPLTTDTPSF